METLSVVVSIVGSTAAGAWFMSTCISRLERAFAIHVIEEKSEREKLEGRVIKLEKRRR